MYGSNFAVVVFLALDMGTSCVLVTLARRCCSTGGPVYVLGGLCISHDNGKVMPRKWFVKDFLGNLKTEVQAKT